MKTVYGLLLAAAVLMLSGCTLLSEERIKLRDLDFTVLSEEKIPAELMTIIEEKKAIISYEQLLKNASNITLSYKIMTWLMTNGLINF